MVVLKIIKKALAIAFTIYKIKTLAISNKLKRIFLGGYHIML